jgi:GNAT superfamily N-acetyltransferase
VPITHKGGRSVTLSIRPSTVGDLDGLVPLFDAYRMFFAGGTPQGSREFLSARLTTGDSIFLLALEDGDAVGFLTLYPLFSSWYATRIWFLSDLYVREDARKGGIGKKLVEAAKDFAREGGSRSIMVEIPHREPHLVKFYEDLHFMRDRDFNLHRFYVA